MTKSTSLQSILQPHLSDYSKMHKLDSNRRNDIAEVLSPLRNLDKWIRRRLRSYVWKQWGRRGYRMLRRLGVKRQLAWNTAKSAHGPWRLSASPALYYAMPNKYFRSLGLPELVAR